MIYYIHPKKVIKNESRQNQLNSKTQITMQYR